MTLSTCTNHSSSVCTCARENLFYQSRKWQLFSHPVFFVLHNTLLLFKRRYPGYCHYFQRKVLLTKTKCISSTNLEQTSNCNICRLLLYSSDLLLYRMICCFIVLICCFIVLICCFIVRICCFIVLICCFIVLFAAL